MKNGPAFLPYLLAIVLAKSWYGPHRGGGILSIVQVSCIWRAFLAEQVLQVPGAGGVRGPVQVGAEAVEALQQRPVAPRVAAAEGAVAPAEGEGPRRPERRLEVQALRVRPARARAQRRRQQQRQRRPAQRPHPGPAAVGGAAPSLGLPPPAGPPRAPPGRGERGLRKAAPCGASPPAEHCLTLRGRLGEGGSVWFQADRNLPGRSAV